MPEVDALKNLIRQAFADVSYPGDGNLVAHANYGDEYTFTKEAFRGRDDWRTLEWEFLDDAPDGYSSALSFFMPEAFRFYLPAYLLADLDKQLERVKPYFHLYYGLTDADHSRPTNRKTRQEARLRGGQTRFEARSQDFANFTPAQVDAVVAYLHYKLKELSPYDSSRESIIQALQSYWLNHTSDSGINKRNSDE
jgi:hypothetical protein